MRESKWRRGRGRLATSTLWTGAAAMLVLVICLGCPRSDAPESKRAPESRPAAGQPDGVRPAAGEKEPPPPPPTIPKVAMAETDLATCRVRVGDTMPEGELPNADGKKVALRSLLGKKLTVVLFWNAKSIYASENLEDLERDFGKPYGDKGVAVVAVNVGDTAEAVRQKAKDAAGVSYPLLVDADGSYFAKVATERLPRTYLLDDAGKILWFDIEFSRSTRRELEQGIKVALGELK